MGKDRKDVKIYTSEMEFYENNDTFYGESDFWHNLNFRVLLTRLEVKSDSYTTHKRKQVSISDDASE